MYFLQVQTISQFGLGKLRSDKAEIFYNTTTTVNNGNDIFNTFIKYWLCPAVSPAWWWWWHVFEKYFRIYNISIKIGLAFTRDI